ncbi:MAG: hypothetical protein MJ174_09425 [Treponema sp.]|nr:hypothetical protein [Treponema sp.]
MPLARKTTTTDLPEALSSQIANNFKKDDVSVVTSNPTATKSSALTSDNQSKSKYSDSVNLRLTSGKRNEFKKFFTDCEISMNQGFEMAVDYIMREARAGRIYVSKSGITKTEE